MTKFQMLLVLFGVATSFAMATGCGDDDDSEGSDADTDVDSDTDTDTDSDTDTGTDADTDADTDTDTDTDTDADTDTDTSEIEPGDIPFDINCEEEGHLVNYGIKTITEYSGAGTEQEDVSAVYTYNWESGVLTSSHYKEFDSGTLLYEYDRTFNYDESGLLTKIDWQYEYEGTQYHYWRSFTYDEQDRIIEEASQYETADAGVPIDLKSTTYAYNEDGFVAEELIVLNPEEFPSYYGTGYGYTFEYDEEGRNTVVHYLDSDNEWADTGVSDELIYDDLGRISEVQRGYSPAYSEIFTYKGDTPQIIYLGDANDVYRNTFEWEGDSLTSTYWSGGVQSRQIIEFTAEGNSSFHEIYPPNASWWLMWYFGMGYMNGCAGITQ